jgi:AraC-binding-like domain
MDVGGSKADMSPRPSSRRSIPAIRYDNPRDPDLPLEIMSFSELRVRATPEFRASPRRPKFHQVHVVTDGRSEIEVDFECLALDRSTVAWVRPGQVLRYDLPARVDGWLLMFTAEFLDAEVADQPFAARVDLGSAVEDVAWLVGRLRRVYVGGAQERETPLAAPPAPCIPPHPARVRQKLANALSRVGARPLRVLPQRG